MEMGGGMWELWLPLAQLSAWNSNEKVFTSAWTLSKYPLPWQWCSLKHCSEPLRMPYGVPGPRICSELFAACAAGPR